MFDQWFSLLKWEINSPTCVVLPSCEYINKHTVIIFLNSYVWGNKHYSKFCLHLMFSSIFRYAFCIFICLYFDNMLFPQVLNEVYENHSNRFCADCRASGKISCLAFIDSLLCKILCNTQVYYTKVNLYQYIIAGT
jgi:hypothetical protein